MLTNIQLGVISKSMLDFPVGMIIYAIMVGRNIIAADGHDGSWKIINLAICLYIICALNNLYHRILNE